VEIGSGEVPVVVAGFIEKVKSVEPLDPADLYLHVQILWIGLNARILVVGEHIHPNGIVIRHYRPVICVTVDTGDLVGRELKDFVSCPWALDRQTGERENREKEDRTGNYG
jgi:hypothetical protein